MKTLGFTSRQLAATIAWQASVIAAITAVIGVPVGIAAGRQLWILFARKHQCRTPAHRAGFSDIDRRRRVLIVVGVLILANVAAAIPARTPAALVLRTE